MVGWRGGLGGSAVGARGSALGRTSGVRCCNVDGCVPVVDVRLMSCGVSVKARTMMLGATEVAVGWVDG